MINCNSDVYCFQFNVVSYAVLFIFGAAVSNNLKKKFEYPGRKWFKLSQHSYASLFELFQYILTLNVAYNRKLQQMTRNEYCLSRSYQIRENIRIMQVRRVSILTPCSLEESIWKIRIFAIFPDDSKACLSHCHLQHTRLWVHIPVCFSP